MERLQKTLARAGVASRRKAEELIAQGCVRVNGLVVKQLGVQVDPGSDRIEVDGVPVRLDPTLTYLMLNKPAGVVSTRSDPQDRLTVIDLLPQKYKHLHPVGRLDADTEGLLLLTNDGEFTHRLTHPRHEVTKRYRAVVQGTVQPNDIRKLSDGVQLDDGTTAPCSVRVVRRGKDRTWVDLELHEGRNRQVRRMLKAVGFPVLKLKRTRVGGLTLRDLPLGSFRLLTRHEVKMVTGNG